MYDFKSLIGSIKTNTDGSTMAMFAVAIPLLLGMVAVSVEAAYFYKSKKDVQLYADMAAYAGALELANSNLIQARNATIVHAIDNGYDGSRGRISVNIPPQSGAYQNAESVEIVITQSGSQFFSKLVSHQGINYTVRAVASRVRKGNACMMALYTGTNSGSVDIGGGTTLNMPGCTIESNSSATNSISIGNNTTVNVDCVRSVGGISGSANFTCDAMAPHSESSDDPYASMPAPDISSLGCSTPVTVGSTIQLTAGLRYCSNITISHRIELLGNGPIYFDNANLNFRRNANVVGASAAIVLMNDSAINGLNGTASIQISAPTTGTYAGFVVYSDPATQPADNWTTFNGSSTSSFDGILYYPNQNLNFGGNSASAGACTVIVASRIALGGTSELDSSGCEAKYGVDVPGAGSGNQFFIVE